MGFRDIINEVNIDFFDREIIIGTLKSEYQRMLKETGYCKVYSYFGMGGIGKSRLLDEIKIQIAKMSYTGKDCKLIDLTLEISNSDNYLDALVRIREQISSTCPLFDYALLTYWNRTQINKFNDKFLESVKSQWFQLFIEFASVLSFTVPRLPQFISLPVDKLAEGVKTIYTQVRKKLYSRYFKENFKDISLLSTEKLKSCLGGFLGIELNRLFYDKHLVTIIDSYQQYDDIHFVDWLLDFIQEAHTGLFLVSSREKINFSSIKHIEIIEKEVDTLPEKEARALLLKYIPRLDNRTMKHIFTITGRIPIYLNLLVNAYLNCYDSEVSFYHTDFYMLHNKNEVVKCFFIHLNQREHDFMLALSLVQIFDRNIFLLLLNLCPGTSVLSYDKICSLSMVTKDSSFNKIHDVINTNVIEIIAYYDRYLIFQKYIAYISQHTLQLLDDSQKITIYKHLIRMIIKNKFDLQQQECEHLLDIFFQLKQTLKTVLPSGIEGLSSYPPLNDIYYFTKAVAEEREDTLARLSWLDNVNFIDNRFGKHNKSIKIIKGYLISLTGDPGQLADAIAAIFPKLKDDEVLEWYYAQAHIFWGDYLTFIGDFKKAETILIGFLNKISSYTEQENSSFQVKRHLGHLYRFNLLFCNAEKQYLSTKNSNNSFDNAVQEIYIITNLCENNCYLNPDEVLENYKHGLLLAKSLNDSKSMAKIYYSTAIAFLHYRKFKRAKKFIRKSMFYNKKDGYKLGLLSPMLADIYLQKALGLPIQRTSFIRLLDEVNAYGFLRLALAVIDNDQSAMDEIKTQYQWLDFDKTVNAYRKFISAIQP